MGRSRKGGSRTAVRCGQTRAKNVGFVSRLSSLPRENGRIFESAAGTVTSETSRVRRRGWAWVRMRV